MLRNSEVLIKNVTKNDTGYYELASSCRRVMDSFYENEYYQKDTSFYKKSEYTEEEVLYRTNLYREKECMLDKIGGVKGSLLDVGCGEGHVLKHFSDKGWYVRGIDFSEFGIKMHNPDMLSCLLKGNIMKIIAGLDKKFDFVNMDNVFEHLPDPVGFLRNIKNVLNKRSILCIRVPNDFSITQIKAFENYCIDDPFWVTDKTSEHFNYFTGKSLRKFAKDNGFICLGQVADWPIDFNLFNPRTNYYKNKSVGHDGHIARLNVENMLFEQSIEKTLAFHEVLADLGVGRNVSVYLRQC